MRLQSSGPLNENPCAGRWVTKWQSAAFDQEAGTTRRQVPPASVLGWLGQSSSGAKMVATGSL